MFYSYFVYSLLVLSVSLSTYYAWRNKAYSVLWIPIFIYIFVTGCRYEVGTDWENYKSYYLEALRGDESGLEFLYASLNKIIAYFKFDYYVLFIMIAFIHIKILYKFLLSHTKILFFGIVLFFLGGPFFSSLNIIRQATSFFIFLLSIKYIVNKDFKRYVLMILIAYGFHTSSIILFPLYFVNRISKNFVYNRMFMALLFVFSLVVGEFVLSYVLELFFANVISLQYVRYESTFDDSNLSYGLGFLSIKLIDFSLLFFAPRLFELNKRDGFLEIWWIYFIGVLIYNLGMANELIIRASYCMVNLRFIILAYFIHYSFSNTMRHKLTTCFAMIVLFLNIISFYSSILNSHSGCSPFMFFFE